MSLMAKLTVTPLLYACGALALLSVGLGVALALARADVRAITAEAGAANEELYSAQTERDAWKGKAAGCVESNEAYADVVGTLNGELELAQQENRRIKAEGQAAIAAARAAARDADRTLKRMAGQFQAQSREPPCAAAVARVAQACPAFEGY